MLDVEFVILPIALPVKLEDKKNKAPIIPIPDITAIDCSSPPTTLWQL